MKKEGLLAELTALNVLQKYYSIGNEIKDDAYNIERIANGKYAYYYYERGEKQGYREYEALVKLIEILKFNLDNKTDLTK